MHYSVQLRKKLGWSVQILGGPDPPPDLPSGCALGSCMRTTIVHAVQLSLCPDCAAFVCHTCQYSENVPLIGYECVTSPANYSLGPATGACSTPCHTLRQISISECRSLSVSQIHYAIWFEAGRASNQLRTSFELDSVMEYGREPASS